MSNTFLPINKEDMSRRKISSLDFVYVCGDAYVDHPSFGAALICRLLESHGYTVGIIAQPNWKDDNSITILGTPRLGFLVSAGNMDSMVNHFTAAKKRRHEDAYSPGGAINLRPDRTTIVYCNLIRKVYKNSVPILIGGIEASLRRLAHYDYWKDKVMRSILLDSQADLLMYGMGEHSIIEIADALNAGIDIKDINYINGTVFKSRSLEGLEDSCWLPTFNDILESKESFAKSYYAQYNNTDPYTGKRLIEKYSDNEFIVQNPPSLPLTEAEMDDVYALPFMRAYHPSYEKAGGIPAINEVKFSLTSCRGCFGACSFCALTFHQGRIVQSRSHKSLVDEAILLTEDKDFKGYINDVGGPTANFRFPSCEKQLKQGVCSNKQCMFPTPCKNLKVDHSDYLELLNEISALPKVKKVFVRSGIRFDYLMLDKDDTFFRELCENHISGQLKVAPEHVCDSVLSLMGKPPQNVYERFLTKYKRINKIEGKDQYVVPYLMSSHPGSTLKEAIALAEAVRDMGYMPQQVQDFYPTPSTISTCMYYTGLDPRNMNPVYVPTDGHEKAIQRALIQFRDPANYDLVHEALELAGRLDLIGNSPNCLIKNERPMQKAQKDVHGNVPYAAKPLTGKQNIAQRNARKSVEKWMASQQNGDAVKEEEDNEMNSEIKKAPKTESKNNTHGKKNFSNHRGHDIKKNFVDHKAGGVYKESTEPKTDKKAENFTDTKPLKRQKDYSSDYEPYPDRKTYEHKKPYSAGPKKDFNKDPKKDFKKDFSKEPKKDFKKDFKKKYNSDIKTEYKSDFKAEPKSDSNADFKKDWSKAPKREDPNPKRDYKKDFSKDSKPFDKKKPFDAATKPDFKKQYTKKSAIRKGAIAVGTDDSPVKKAPPAEPFYSKFKKSGKR